MTSPASDEWSLLAEGYEDITVPRFQPMHQAMAKYAINYIQHQNIGDKLIKILDFGTGTDGISTISLSNLCLLRLRSW